MSLDIAAIVGKTVAKHLEPTVTPFVKALLEPYLVQVSAFAKWAIVEREVFLRASIEKCADFTARTWDRCSIINTLVFPNQQVTLDRLYVPLRLASPVVPAPIEVTSYRPEFAKHFQRILISDTAGMGKSTILRWLSLSMIKSAAAVPVFVELRKLSESRSLVEEVLAQLDPNGGTFNRHFFFKLVELGRFVFLLDGYDEVAPDQQTAVTADIKSFINRAGNSVFFLTSRPEASLAAFGDFQAFSVDPLAKREAISLIRKYDAISHTKVAEALVVDIEAQHAQVREFLTNPFLLSLLYKTYMYNRNIPARKITFYEEVYTALFKYHDLSKDAYKRAKLAGVDIHDFRLILRELAFATAKLGQIEYGEQQLVAYLKLAAAAQAGIKFKVHDFIHDLCLAVPLFIREGNTYRWAHKALQDFFAAEYIVASDKKTVLLTAIYQSRHDRFFNILDLYYELDYKSFRSVILRAILRDFVSYCDTSYSDVKANAFDVRLRQALMFDRCVALWKGGSEYEFENAISAANDLPAMYYESGFYKSPSSGGEGVLIGTGFARQILDNLINRERDLFIRKFPVEFGHAKRKMLNFTGDPFWLDEELDDIVVPEMKLVVVNDAPNNVANSGSAFRRTTLVLAGHLYQRGHLRVPSYDKCQEALAAIQAEADAAHVDNVLTDI